VAVVAVTTAVARRDEDSDWSLGMSVVRRTATPSP
jgi:hypothetical protein